MKRYLEDSDEIGRGGDLKKPGKKQLAKLSRRELLRSIKNNRSMTRLIEGSR